jgi:hypothetical protein
MSENFDDVFAPENVPASNWFKFDKVGAKVVGTLQEIQDKPAQDVFGAQRVFVLKQADGSTMRVGIPRSKSNVIDRAATAHIGDILGFQYIKEIPSQTKGFAPAKSIECYVKHVEQPIDTSLEDTINAM